jgi:glycosyltransferase involved in cell wall biosynthesis
MRVLMLGWEFPPLISGGLGTACHGLTKALIRAGADLIFVLPRRPEIKTPDLLEVINLQRETDPPSVADGAPETPIFRSVAPAPTARIESTGQAGPANRSDSAPKIATAVTTPPPPTIDSPAPLATARPSSPSIAPPVPSPTASPIAPPSALRPVYVAPPPPPPPPPPPAPPLLRHPVDDRPRIAPQPIQPLSISHQYRPVAPPRIEPTVRSREEYHTEVEFQRVEFVEIDAHLWPYGRPHEYRRHIATRSVVRRTVVSPSDAGWSGQADQQGSEAAHAAASSERTGQQAEWRPEPSRDVHQAENLPVDTAHGPHGAPHMAQPAPAEATGGPSSSQETTPPPSSIQAAELAEQARIEQGGMESETPTEWVVETPPPSDDVNDIAQEPSRPTTRDRRPRPARAGEELFGEIERYAHRAAQSVAGREFDVIHAHDWMTFPAAAAIADMSGAPFIAHVHSTEFDRSGHHIDQRIYDIERAGLERADHIIAVSHLTRGILTSRYAVPREKITVIYNAVDMSGVEVASPAEPSAIKGDEKIVLFLGRITLQKGPEYFLAAARKVLQVYRNVRFVMAGSGDMIRQTIELAHELGIGDKVVFTGFLQGADVERVYRSADLYVMPSVSEPFGLASLEAISYDVPVLISKQSGAAEVLQHVLKVDFWDIEEMANKIVAVLRHPPLRATLKKQAGYEVRRLTWADSAKRCDEVYRKMIGIHEEAA